MAERKSIRALDRLAEQQLQLEGFVQALELHGGESVPDWLHALRRQVHRCRRRLCRVEVLVRGAAR